MANLILLYVLTNRAFFMPITVILGMSDAFRLMFGVKFDIELNNNNNTKH